MTIPAVGAATPGASPQDTPAKIHQAAQQFESLLIGQLLKTSREASGGGGWLGTDDDDAGATGMEIAEQEFAKMLASNGGLGLSKTIEAGLRARSK
jgi:peptidoglycan hydrolase FlgJ